MSKNYFYFHPGKNKRKQEKKRAFKSNHLHALKIQNFFQKTY